MSALAMILTAAMVVPTDATEKVSGEMVQLLDMSGKWEGTAQNLISEQKSRVKIFSGHIEIRGQGGAVGASLKIIDEGRGKLRIEVTVLGAVRRSLGIYKRQGNRLFICCREENKGRPTGFIVDGANSLLILHRVKSYK